MLHRKLEYFSNAQLRQGVQAFCEQQDPAMGATIMTPPVESSSLLNSSIRKRVCKACDRCRLKTSKCDGASPCTRCKADNAICVFGERKKTHDEVYPKGNARKPTRTPYCRCTRVVQKDAEWLGLGTGPAPKETRNSVPLIHDILEVLGALKQDSNTTHDTFQETLNTLQQGLVADDAGFMQRQSLLDSHSHTDSSAPSLMPYESIAHRPNFSNPANLNQLPLEPPNQSPYSQNARAVPPTRSHIYPHATNMQSNQSNWATPVPEFDDSMDFMTQFESPIVKPSTSSVDLLSFSPTMFQEQTMPAAINPCLTMKDWPSQEDFQRYFNTTMLA